MLRLISCSMLLSLAACTDKGDTVPDEDPNGTPVADAGTDKTVSADNTIVLDGSGSYDPDGDQITFHWSFDRVPEDSAMADYTGFPGNNTTANSSQLRPDVAGTYIVQLIVKDKLGAESSPDLVVINVEPGAAPVANAGPDQTGFTGSTIDLDGTDSYDALGRTLTYQWSLTEAPANSGLTAISADTSSIANITPDVGGTYVVSLVVNNGLSDSEPDTAAITVKSENPLPPIADSGDDIKGAYDCTAVGLDGSDSYDPNGDLITYEWSIQSKPSGSTTSNASILDRNAAITAFYPDSAGTYVLSLAVHDGTEWSTPDLLNVTTAERPYNTAPVVEAGKGWTIDAGEAICEEDGYSYDCDSCGAVSITLGSDASAVDDDGDPMTLLWEVVGDVTADITDPTALETTVKLSGATPTEPGACEDTEYTFRLSATDCPGEVGSDTVTFVVTCCGVEQKDTAK
jgi:predicted small lipoprotein YifL